MKQNLLFGLFFIFGSFAYAQSPNALRTIDSLTSIVQSESNLHEKSKLYRQIFEEHKLSQFEVALWASQGGLRNIGSGDTSELAYFNEAVGYSFQKLFVMDSALTYYLKSLELYKANNRSIESARVMDAIARIHRKLLNHEKALWYYSQAFAIHDELDDDEGRARILNERGAVYENMGETRKALNEYRASLDIQMVRNDSVGIGYSLEFIGYNYLQQDSLELSEEYLLKALEYRRGMADEFALMLNEYALGELYNAKGNYELSDSHLNECFSLSRKLSFVDIRQYALDIAISNRKMQGDFERAIQLLETKNSLSDSLSQVANQARVDELSEKYQSVERENQILVQKNEIQKQDYWIYGLSTTSLLLVLIAFLIFKQQKLRQAQMKQEADLKLAMSTIETQNRLQELRMEISRDLHDNIGTQLTFVISSIDTIKHLLVDGASTLVQSKLERVSTFTRDTIRELRDTIWAMNTADITIEDLKNRILNFVDQARESMQTVEFNFVDETPELDSIHFNSKDGMNVYRIIQEAINNAMKHAGATSITVKMTLEESNLMVRVNDDGSGMGDQPKLGNGMLTMKKRAEELKGELDVDSSPSGTQLMLNLTVSQS